MDHAFVAVINVGKWNYGQPNKVFTTFLYGHPRQSALDLLFCEHHAQACGSEKCDGC